MTTQEKIDLIHALTMSFVLIFSVVALIVGFLGARFMGLPVDAQLFYSTLVPLIFLIGGRITKSDKKEKSDG
jgi:hypothetical protein